jgi:hypothetical protein
MTLQRASKIGKETSKPPFLRTWRHARAESLWSSASPPRQMWRSRRFLRKLTSHRVQHSRRWMLRGRTVRKRAQGGCKPEVMMESGTGELPLLGQEAAHQALTPPPRSGILRKRDPSASKSSACRLAIAIQGASSLMRSRFGIVPSGIVGPPSRPGESFVGVVMVLVDGSVSRHSLQTVATQGKPPRNTAMQFVSLLGGSGRSLESLSSPLKAR